MIKWTVHPNAIKINCFSYVLNVMKQGKKVEQVCKKKLSKFARVMVVLVFVTQIFVFKFKGHWAGELADSVEHWSCKAQCPEFDL